MVSMLANALHTAGKDVEDFSPNWQLAVDRGFVDKHLCKEVLDHRGRAFLADEVRALHELRVDLAQVMTRRKDSQALAVQAAIAYAEAVDGAARKALNVVAGINVLISFGDTARASEGAGFAQRLVDAENEDAPHTILPKPLKAELAKMIEKEALKVKIELEQQASVVHQAASPKADPSPNKRTRSYKLSYLI